MYKKIFSLLIFTFLVSACGLGQQYDEGHPSEEDKDTVSSSWDKMKWDKGKWK